MVATLNYSEATKDIPWTADPTNMFTVIGILIGIGVIAAIAWAIYNYFSG